MATQRADNIEVKQEEKKKLTFPEILDIMKKYHDSEDSDLKYRLLRRSINLLQNILLIKENNYFGEKDQKIHAEIDKILLQ